MKLFAALLTALLITGCSGCASFQTQEQKVQLACASAATALDVLAIANNEDKLTAQQQHIVIEAAGHITPICTAPTTPTLDQIKMEAFMQAIEQLQTNAALVENK